MMRKTPASSMQKTYDECYLICSTAIYFEGQNNEPEALRSWRNALDQIYYHNAYKIPASYVPRSETEKALHDSLRAMELQCKERVDLLEALKKSRQEADEEATKSGGKAGDNGLPSKSRESLPTAGKTTADRNGQRTASWLGSDSVPPATYADIPRPPALPERRPANQLARPSYRSKKSSAESATQAEKLSRAASPALTAPTQEKPGTRTPSPDKKSGGMLKTLRSNPRERPTSGKATPSLRTRAPAAAASAATQVWSGPVRPTSTANGALNPASAAGPTGTGTTWDPYTRSLVDRTHVRDSADNRRVSAVSVITPPSPTDYMQSRHSEDLAKPRQYPPPYPDYPTRKLAAQDPFASFDYDPTISSQSDPPPPPPPHRMPAVSPIPLQPAVAAPPPQPTEKPDLPSAGLPQMPPSSISYMKEYPNHPPNPKTTSSVPVKTSERATRTDSPSKPSKLAPAVPRKAVSRAAGVVSATAERQKLDDAHAALRERTKAVPRANRNDSLSSSPDNLPVKTQRRRAEAKSPRAVTPPTTDDSPDSESNEPSTAQQVWDERVKQIMKKLPKGVDENAAKQIFNEIVIKGDEVHWDDVAGLEIAKSALKETVVYPFLRPDLFMGLREPARGMLLFGPPGTGKTMLARAVATESRSVFFAISASSLTSKFLGESEKLVRALFALAKELAPSIIFVDEIDSLLGSRGGSSEHEATRRIKTEFLIQWSDLQKAAAGRAESDSSRGDATRVLVLAATNLPWAIDEAARRRFVRRQYIPLPEDWVREKQLRTLLSAQKHNLKDRHLKMLVMLTEGFSGSDITALAKDAAMGPLRSLGEKLLHMSPDDIRPIGMQDFEASLVNIRPSVSKQGLKEFEDWAKEFGERGG